MDRTTRREMTRAAAKYAEHCAACKQPYASKACAATYTGTHRGKWVAVCQDCHDKGLIDQVYAVGIYQSDNAEAVAQARQLLAPFLRRMQQGGHLVRHTAEQQAEIAAEFRRERPDQRISFPPPLNA